MMIWSETDDSCPPPEFLMKVSREYAQLMRIITWNYSITWWNKNVESLWGLKPQPSFCEKAVYLGTSRVSCTFILQANRRDEDCKLKLARDWSGDIPFGQALFLKCWNSPKTVVRPNPVCLWTHVPIHIYVEVCDRVCCGIA